MEIYSPKRTATGSFYKNETKQETAKGSERSNYFYDIKPVKTRHETLTEWFTRRFFEPMKAFFENDIVE